MGIQKQFEDWYKDHHHEQIGSFDGECYANGYQHTLWVGWQAAIALERQKLSFLLCDEHLKKCDSPTGIFNSNSSEEEPCLICIAEQAKASVAEGFVLVDKSKISYFYQDSDEPENCCNHERDFDCLGGCIDDGDIVQIDRYADIHLSKDTFYGSWCECEPKPFSRKTREFRLFPSREDAEKSMIKAQEQVG